MAKVQSLASQAPKQGGTLTNALAALGDVIPADSAFEVTPIAQSSSPYVTFPYPISSNWSNVLAKFPGHEQGHPILVYNGEMYQLKPLRFVLFKAKQYFSKEDAKGNIVKAAYQPDLIDKKDRREYVDTVCGVFYEDKLVPARITFKTTKVNGVVPAVVAYGVAQSEEWGKKSNEHKLTLQVPDVRFRYFCEVKLTSCTSRSSGLIYQKADGIIKPTTAADWKIIVEAMGDEEVIKHMNDCLSDFDARIKTVEGKM